MKPENEAQLVGGRRVDEELGRTLGREVKLGVESISEKVED